MLSNQRPTFRRKLTKWYGDRGRDLPWRKTADPYKIWVSEIMLQQTTVKAVIPYFERFIQRFPTVDKLAEANESEVLKHWEGLGYYSRARNLHKAAKVVVEKYRSHVPSSLRDLQLLPGVGRYTAGAIISFAFDQKAPIVEANTLRLYCRLLNYEGDPRSRAGQDVLWQFAESILPNVSPGKLNQALMELGATVCTPIQPACDSCPIRQHCGAFHQGTQAITPRPKMRPTITEITEISIAIQKGNEFLLRKRADKERWAGLWDFVRFEIKDVDASSSKNWITESVQKLTGLKIEIQNEVAKIRHSVTRYRITLTCLSAKRINGRLKKGETWQWVNPKDFTNFAFSTSGRKFAEQLMQESHASKINVASP